jgi:hypothetical protein
MSTGGVPFTLNLPPDWMILDLEGDRIPIQVERLMIEAAQRDPNVAAHRGALEKQVRSALREVRSSELSFCAMLSRVIDDVLPMSATITVALRNVPADAGDMVSQLHRLPGARVTQFDLPSVGSIVKVAHRSTANSGVLESTPIEAAVVQYFIPTPRGSRMAVITAATPVLPLADHFESLFDEIARSFAFEPADSQAVGGRRP